ncbi:MAG: nicotinamide-nucleotide amidohydrolase family protein [Gammaproteobacteria bacterium]|nr:nicotinamide-nucleotide amidohydrolase family protein [Gammaproteobacteria bacterium]MCP5199210.1 nicotinamide-nucleotide amidohydrolase family protein [Gammaproteobacteria bacterium]
MSAAPDQDALETLARELGEALLERGWRAATAESCTGGWIAQAITAIAGSSDWFEAGLVTYSNAAKISLLGVAPMLIERHGAVSAETAAAMAAGALRVTGADIACAVTGVAGPGGGSAAKPVGTVWFGFATRTGGAASELGRFDGDRRAVRAHTVAHALRGLLDRLA